MKKIMFFIIIFLIIIISNKIDCEENYAPKELIIKLKDIDETFSPQKSKEGYLITGKPKIDFINRKYKVIKIEKIFKTVQKHSKELRYSKYEKKVIEIPDLFPIYKFTFSNSYDMELLANEYRELDEVEYVHPNYKIELFIQPPNDPKFVEQWSLKQTNDCDIDIVEAWELTQNIVGTVTVAVIDTGLDVDHPDFNTNNVIIVSGCNVADNDSDPYDVYGHGTHCAGIISAYTNNNKGIAGIGWNKINIMPIKIFSGSQNRIDPFKDSALT